MRPWGLTPLGTARSAAGIEGASTSHPPYPEDLLETLAKQGIGEDRLFVAWEIARLASDLCNDEHRALTLIVLGALASMEEGSTRIPTAGYLPGMLASLDTSGDLPAVDAILERAASDDPGSIARVIGRSGDRVPVIIEDGYLTLQRMGHVERRLVTYLATMMSRPPLELPEHRLDELMHDIAAHPARSNKGDVVLSDDQVQAVRTAIRRPLSVISGGPGTGKTSIVVSMLRVLARLPDPGLSSIALAAPTGRAADRMRTSIERALSSIESPDASDEALLERIPAARTLHRLLGYSPTTDRFRHHENNPLEERFVIVDESSMIDLDMMERLIRSLRPDAQLVLLGDAEQLPSVQAGSVLRDTMHAALSAGCASVLTHSWRMDPADPSGRAILQVARRINAGDTGTLIDTDPDTCIVPTTQSTFAGVQLTEPGDASLAPTLSAWRDRMHDDLDSDVHATWRVDGSDDDELAKLFEHLDRFRILCVTRIAGRTSERAVNEWFHDRFLTLARARHEIEDPATGLLAGEPVMVLRNDYERGLFNGDQGVVLHLPSGLHAVFRRASSFVAIPVDQLVGSIQQSWAITVHKAQGSEFDHVLVILPDEDMRLLTREILYTAVTRARRSVTIAASRALVEKAARTPMQRWSGLADALAGTG